MSRARGFTLIEMLVVLLIMGLLASAAIPLAQLSQRRVKESELHSALRTLRTAIDTYKRAWDEGHVERRPDDTGYPPNLQTLVRGVPDAKDPKGRRIYFLRRLPRDPFADADLDPSQTWALRSYPSPPETPAAGDDVYDVSSMAPGIGLDGVPYVRW